MVQHFKYNTVAILAQAYCETGLVAQKTERCCGIPNAFLGLSGPTCPNLPSPTGPMGPMGPTGLPGQQGPPGPLSILDPQISTASICGSTCG